MHWYQEHKSNLTVGQRAADAIRNGMGSWLFVSVSMVFLAVWILTQGDGVDPKPYILLNLVLSCLAALQGSILLIAAKRQDEIAAALAQHDYEVNLDSKEMIKDLQKAFVRMDNKLDALLSTSGRENRKPGARL